MLRIGGMALALVAQGIVVTMIPQVVAAPAADKSSDGWLQASIAAKRQVYTVGKPITVTFTVKCTSPKAVFLWSRGCSWGCQVYSFNLTKPDGAFLTLSEPPREWRRNAPGANELKPGEAFSLDFDLNKMSAGPLAAGKYVVRGVYQTGNPFKGQPGFARLDNVWEGKLVTDAISLEIIADESSVSLEVPAVVDGSNAFAMDLYAKLAAKDKGNLFFSPSSIDAALAMTYGGAAGDTAKQMAKTLHFTLAAEQLHPAFAALLKQLNTPPPVGKGKDKQPAYQLAVANALWGQKDYGFKVDFVRLLRANYGASLREVESLQTEHTRKAINDWVAQQTRDKIKDLIPEGCLGENTRLVLTNAIYFKSKWMYEFRKDATANGSFNLLTGKSVEVPLMHQRADFGYMENDDLQLLELPYLHNEASMVIVLPKKADGLASVEEQLSVASLAKWLRAERPFPSRSPCRNSRFRLKPRWPRRSKRWA